MTVQIKIPPAKYKMLEELAVQRQMVAGEILELAISEWLERETRLQEARQLMRRLGEGLGKGLPPHDHARNLDHYLYC